MRTAPALLVGLCITTLIGCEGSSLPLGPADQAPVDLRLVGTWDLVPTPDEEERAAMHILQFNEHEFYLEYIAEDGGLTRSGGGADTLRFRAFATPIDEVLFANLQCLNCDERLYLFFRYELSGDDRLLVREFSDDAYKESIQQMGTSDEIRAFVSDHLDEESLYGSAGVTFRRRPSGDG